jgi:hypothetical protein
MFLPNKICYYSNNEFYIIEGNTSFSRQHHSTNTLGDQHVFFVRLFLLILNLYLILFVKDHHVPLNEQEQQNIESNEIQNERPLTPINHHHYGSNVWVNLIKEIFLFFKSLFSIHHN